MKFLIAATSILISLNSYANWEQVHCSGYPEAVNLALTFEGNTSNNETLSGNVVNNYDSATLKISNCKKAYANDVVKSIHCKGLWNSGEKLLLSIARATDGTYKGQLRSDNEVKRFGCIVLR